MQKGPVLKEEYSKTEPIIYVDSAFEFLPNPNPNPNPSLHRLLPAPFLLSLSDFVFSFSLIFFGSVPCARLS